MSFRGESIVGSSLINTAAGLTSLVAGFGASVIVARLLGVEGVGIVAYALWFMTLATLVSDFGMPQAALRFIAGDLEEGDSRSGLFRTLTKRFVLTTTITAIAILGYASWLYIEHDNAASLVWVATTVLFLSYAYSTMSLGASHGLGQFRRAARRTVTGCIIQPFAILLGALVLGPAGAILGHATRHLPQALALRNYLSKDASAAAPITPPVKQYARHNWLTGSISSILNSRVELAIIGWFFSFVEVGYYAIAMTMASLVTQLSTFLLANIVPYFGSLHDREDMTSLTLAYERSLRWLGIILAPICFGGAAIAPVLLPAVFGDAFAPAVGIAEILIAFSFVAGLELVASRMVLARQRSGALLKIAIACGAGCIVLMMAVIPFFGGLGAAWVKAAVSLAMLGAVLWYCRSRLDMPRVAGNILKVVCAGLLSAVAARLCIYWMPGLAGMSLGIVAGAVVYVASLLLLSVVPADERASLGGWLQSLLPARLRRRRRGRYAKQDAVQTSD